MVPKSRAQTPNSLLFCVGLLTLCPLSAIAAPGYTYEEIIVEDTILVEGANSQHLAINNSGDVVFQTQAGCGSGCSSTRYYVSRPASDPGSPRPEPIRLFESQSDDMGSGPQGNPSYPVGINDDGIVAIPLQWPVGDPGQFEYGYGLFDPSLPGTGVDRMIREIRNDIDGSSSGRVNNSLQMAARANVEGQWAMIVSDGINSDSVPSLFAQSDVQVNNAGTVASSAVSAANNRVIQWWTPPGSLQFASIGPSSTLGYSSNGMTPGLNDRGWMSISTDNDNNSSNPNPRVLLISPAGDLFTIAETENSEFINFRQPRIVSGRGVPINNFNRVSFVAQRFDPVDEVDRDALWIGDASGDAPKMVMESSNFAGTNRVIFTNGRQLRIGGMANDVSNHSANVLNDKGEIAYMAFGTLYDDQGNQIVSSTRSLFVARPIAGSEPGSPILPAPADALPGENAGWRFRGRCWRASVEDILGSCDALGGVSEVSPRIWIDPPIAVGYDYAIDEGSLGAFTSVMIPAPLPGGDDQFEIEVNGAPAEITAGTPFEFSTVTPEPVRSFRIAGISQDEVVDPDDPSAFVAGLTFSVDTDEDVSYTMVPVVVNIVDSDGDGIPDEFDDFPNDPTQSGDTDGDGVDDNIDNDDDGDGVDDIEDDYPWGRFDDAMPGFWAFPFVEALARAGITAGCGGNNYCPDDLVNRAQMAVFLERGINGSDYSPPAATGTVFNDVGAGDFAASFIEQLFADGVTVGCGNNNYCPGATVTRSQMAVFLLRAKYGPDHIPPPATGIFADVPLGTFADAWIEQLAADGITSGCGNGNFCPFDPVTRAQMSVFLVRLFEL